MSRAVVVVVVVAACAACAPDPDGRPPADGGVDVDCDPFAVDVVSFVPGRNAGFGVDGMPDIVLGPPEGLGDGGGGTDIVSLGVGGVITVELGCEAIDGDGVDLVVYENAFLFERDDEVLSFAEAGEVSVSADGNTFAAFPCVAPEGSAFDGADDDGVDGCAGMTPVQATADNGLGGVFPDGGGDGFDLSTIGIERARFVRITDRARGGAGQNAGFDLDAVAAIVRRP